MKKSVGCSVSNMKIDFDFICVDFQNDFADAKGKNCNKGSSVKFIKEVLFPFLRRHNLQAAEIISDYRLPRGKSKNESCVPGTEGYLSLLPEDLKKGSSWIKCMHSPLWVRKNIGIANAEIGEIYQDPQGFGEWVNKNVTNKKVILFGETADCCLLQTASELYFRGYDVYVIYEATDPMNERLDYKEDIIYHSSLAIYAKTVHFAEFVEMIGGN